MNFEKATISGASRASFGDSGTLVSSPRECAFCANANATRVARLAQALIDGLICDADHHARPLEPHAVKMDQSVFAQSGVKLDQSNAIPLEAILGDEGSDRHGDFAPARLYSAHLCTRMSALVVDEPDAPARRHAGILDFDPKAQGHVVSQGPRLAPQTGDDAEMIGSAGGAVIVDDTEITDPIV